MKAYCDDICLRVEAAGRKPDDVKVLFLASPVVGETEAEARASATTCSSSETAGDQQPVSLNAWPMGACLVSDSTRLVPR